MRRWKDRLATLFLVVAVGLSLLPWVYQPKNVVADPPDYICYNDIVSDENNPCLPPAINCFCEIIITPEQD